MSILGYSSSYFLPEYWAGTPLYGEKIIPLIDYILSTDFADSDKLAGAFYNIVNKYRSTDNLPIEQIKDLIAESGYSYVLDLLGEDDESIRLLTYLLVLIHQNKGSERGIKLVLNLLKKEKDPLTMCVIGDLFIPPSKEVIGFSESKYIIYTGFSPDKDPFELTFQVKTDNLLNEQCIASVGEYGFYLGVLSNGKLTLSLGSTRNSWNISNRKLSTNTLLPNSNYFVKLTFDGVSYDVRVSADNNKYANYITVESNTPINIHEGSIYIGIDNSEGTLKNPFKGYINLTPFSVDVDNIIIDEWFRTEEMGEEDTFLVKADLDVGLLGSDFFRNFANFARKYVYPSLSAFEARMSLKNNFVFLPYIREKVTYIAKVNLLTFSRFMTKVYDYKNVYLSDNFIITESPNITATGIASGFSTSNKIDMNYVLNPQDNPITIYLPFTTGSNINSLQCFANVNNGIYGRVDTGKIKFAFGYDSSTWTFDDNIDNAAANTSYVLKLTYDLTTYRIYLSTNGSDFILKNEIISSKRLKYQGFSNFAIGGIARTGIYPWLGSIDLKQLSVIVNNKEVSSGGTYEWEDFYSVNEDDGQPNDEFSVIESKL